MTTTHYDPNDPRLVFIQSRADVDFNIIDEYAALMADGVLFDPVSAILDLESGNILIWDGYHRGEAAKKAGEFLSIAYRSGTREEAKWLALSANQKHGLRRSRADKQRITKNALLHPKAATLSDRELARHCGVDHKTVGRVRKELEASGEIPQMAERTVTRNGTTYSQVAKPTPTYAPIWDLERGVKAWLDGSPTDRDRLWALEQIKAKTEMGQEFLAELMAEDGDIYLPAPRRKRDVVQACNNVLDQLRRQQQEKAAESQKIVALLQLENLVKLWLNDLANYTDAKDHIELLTEIKQRSDKGEQLLSDISAVIAHSHETPHERSTLRHACCNVLAELRRKTCVDEREMIAAADPTHFPGCSQCGSADPGGPWQIAIDDHHGVLCWPCSQAGLQTEAKASQTDEAPAEPPCIACTRTDDWAGQWIAGIAAESLCPQCMRTLGEALINAAETALTELAYGA